MSWFLVLFWSTCLVYGKKPYGVRPFALQNKGVQWGLPHILRMSPVVGALPILKYTMKVIMKINIHKLQCVCGGVGGGGRFLPTRSLYSLWSTQWKLSGGWWWRKVLTHEELVLTVKHTMKVIVKINVHRSQCIGRGRFLWMNSFYPLWSTQWKLSWKETYVDHNAQGGEGSYWWKAFTHSKAHDESYHEKKLT